MVYFPPDYREPPQIPADEGDGEVFQKRCCFCEGYYEQAKSDAMNYRDFCSIHCEEQSADAERVR